MTFNYQVVVVGGGPAGLTTACDTRGAGAEQVLVLERDKEPSGILNQCIHNGSGLHYFKEELTDPEYTGRFIQRASELGVEILLDIMVLSVEEDHMVRAINCQDGLLGIQVGAIVLAMGYWECTRGTIVTPRGRPAGAFTVGTTQRYISIEGWVMGRRVAILGSGDINLIMTRRMTLEGANISACVELMSYSNGLSRNIMQCPKGYGIPLHLSYTVTNIMERERVKQVMVFEVGANRRPILGTEITFDCDIVLLSIGLIPKSELTRTMETSIDSRTSGAVVLENTGTVTPGILSCGNVVHVHDLVDFVTVESRRAGAAAARYTAAGQGSPALSCLGMQNSARVTCTVLQKIRPAHVKNGADASFRIDNVYRNRRICVTSSGEELCSFSGGHIAPGETEHIILPKHPLERARDGKLAISLATEKGVKE